MQLHCIDPKRVAEFWPHVRAMLQKAIERGGVSSFDEMERDTLAGRLLLWIAFDGTIRAAATTQLADSRLIIAACGGNGMADWLPLLSRLEAYGKSEGCEAVRIYGRRGWLRALDGFRESAVILDKPINQPRSLLAYRSQVPASPSPL